MPLTPRQGQARLSRPEATIGSLPLSEVDANARIGGCSLFQLAVEAHHTEITRLLLTKPDLDVNCRNSEGRTPLHAAIAGGDMSIAELLLNHKAISFNIDGNEGVHPVVLALNRGDSAMVRRLYKHMSLDRSLLPSFDGLTPLCGGVVRGCHSTIDNILQDDCTRPNLGEHEIEEALHWAIKTRHQRFLS